MPYVDSNGIRIHYQVDGNRDGPPLVLMHGTFQSLEDWYESGWVEGLKNDNQLVLVDHRGMGHSDKPHDPDVYTLELRVADIVAVLDALDIVKAHYFGYSTGGWISFGIAKYAPERFDSLIIGASHTYPRDFGAMRRSLSRGIEAYMEEDFANSPGLVITDWYKTRHLANDHEALIALQQDRPDMSDVIPSMTMPCLMYVGDADPLYPEVIACAKRMPDARLVSLPGLGHGQGFRYSHEGLDHVRNFLAEVSHR